MRHRQMKFVLPALLTALAPGYGTASAQKAAVQKAASPTAPTARTPDRTKGTRAPAREVEAPKAPPIIASMAQLCRVRESEVLQLHNGLKLRAAALSAETDPKKQDMLAGTYQATKRLLAEAEESWQRLGCLNVLYFERGAAGR